MRSLKPHINAQIKKILMIIININMFVISFVCNYVNYYNIVLSLFKSIVFIIYYKYKIILTVKKN